MNIGVVSREYPPHGVYWGAATFYQNLAQALVSRGHQVQVICQAWDRPKSRLDGDIVVHEVGTIPGRGNPLGRINFAINSFRKVRQLVKKGDIDVVNAPLIWGEPFLWAFFKRLCPLVVECHAWSRMLLDTKSYEGAMEFMLMHLTDILERYTARAADEVVANSQMSYLWLTQRAGVDTHKVRLIYEGIDTAAYRFVLSSIRHRLHIDQDAPLCLFVSRLQARKGLHVLAETIPDVLREFPDTRFVLVGKDTNTAPDGGSFIAYLRAQAQKGHFLENLMLLDFLPDEELVQLYSACDVFILPSLSETFGKPVLEAMACHRPVVATATGVSAELSGASRGLVVVPPGEPQTLARAIIDLLSMPRDKREELGKLNRQIVEERFSFQRMVDNIVAVNEGVVAGHQPRKLSRG